MSASAAVTCCDLPAVPQHHQKPQWGFGDFSCTGHSGAYVFARQEATCCSPALLLSSSGLAFPAQTLPSGSAHILVPACLWRGGAAAHTQVFSQAFSKPALLVEADVGLKAFLQSLSTAGKSQRSCQDALRAGDLSTWEQAPVEAQLGARQISTS